MWWVVGGVLIAAAVVRWVSGRDRPDAVLDQPERVRRAFEAVHRRRRTAIAAAAEGPVLIAGKVAARDEPLTSLLTRRPCVLYDVRIDDSMASRNDSRWTDRQPSTVIFKRRDVRPFFVTDETGTALVAFDGFAEVSFVVAAQSFSGRKLREATAIQEALFELGVASHGAISVQEAAIFVGDEVSVAGVGMREVAPDGEVAGLRSAPTRYVVRADTEHFLAILKRKH